MCIYCSLRLQRTLDAIDADPISGFQEQASSFGSLSSASLSMDDFSGRADSGVGQGIRSVSPTNSVTVTSNFSNADINGILAPTAWTSTTITYSFPTAASFYGTSGTYSDPAPFNGFQVLSAAQMSVVQTAFDLISQYTGLVFQQITETASTHAAIRLAGSSSPPTSYAYYPSTLATGGDVFFGNIRNSAPTKAGYEFDTILHEIGHALGLKHGQQADATFGTLPTNHNSTEYSIMDYYSYVGAPTTFYTNLQGSGNQTYMSDDIAALQYLYGANFNANGGGTTYTWSPSTGEEFINGVGQGASSTNTVYESVWDGGGNDTYDLSNYATNLTIDLQPGAWSTFNTTQLAYLDGSNISVRAKGNIINANLYNNNVGSLIENARGGSGNDSLSGNIASNRLDGGAGNDTLTGGLGADTFVYRNGYGADTISDFSLAQFDKIDLSGLSAVTTYSDVLNRASQVGASTVFNFGVGATLTLNNFSLSSLTSAAFVGLGSVYVPPVTTVNVYRFYVPSNADHFYTTDQTEASKLMQSPDAYKFEGVLWKTPVASAGTTNVYRFTSLVNGEHFYTDSASEKDNIIAKLPVYRYEGIAFQSFGAPTTDTITLERFYNPTLLRHHFSSSAEETAGIRAGKVGAGWIDEGTSFIVAPPSTAGNDLLSAASGFDFGNQSFADAFSQGALGGSNAGNASGYSLVERAG